LAHASRFTPELRAVMDLVIRSTNEGAFLEAPDTTRS